MLDTSKLSLSVGLSVSLSLRLLFVSARQGDELQSEY